MLKKFVWMIPVLTVLALSFGCSKKSPKTAPDAMPETAPAPRVERSVEAPAPGPQDPWDGDIDAVNRLAFEQGLLNHVYFDFDQYELRSDARDQLTKNAAFLKQYPQFVILIEGHCDEWGTAEYNLALGDRRASMTREYLGRLGVDPSRVQVVSMGKERPSCTEAAESCWGRNRRAHFAVVGRTTAS